MSASLPNVSNMCVNEQCELNAYTVTKVGIVFFFSSFKLCPFFFASFQIGDDGESIVF